MIRKLVPGDQELDEALDRGYAEGGYRAALQSWVVAFIYAWAGERERTLEWLELAYQAHDLGLPSANSSDFDLVHDDPRYQDLRRRMNLPQ
jgi:hypothetical protein